VALEYTESAVGEARRALKCFPRRIGTGLLGVLAAGMLSEWLGSATAVLMMAGFGLAGLSLVWIRLVPRCA
jgi:hypothetical protein